MRALLDVNVLIALFDQDHVSHKAAMTWFAAHATEGWASCPITQNGCVRIMSNPSYPNPLPVQALITRLAQACAHRYINSGLTAESLGSGLLRRDANSRSEADYRCIPSRARRASRRQTCDIRRPDIAFSRSEGDCEKSRGVVMKVPPRPGHTNAGERPLSGCQGRREPQRSAGSRRKRGGLYGNW